MYKVILLSLILFMLGAEQKLFSQQLSTRSYISLITAAPGEDLYSVFGHNALRVRDDSLGIDWVYNYGTFSFEEPNFYLKFMRGKLNYILSVAPFDRFYLSYQYEQRALYEQILNLSQGQKQRLFDRLNENYLPENRAYKYDFFFDNCATRVRDIVKEVLADSLVYGSTHVSDEKTFRDLIDIYLEVTPWADYGIDLLLGNPTDAVAASEEYLFLPDFMDSAFQHSRIIHQEGEKDLVLSRTVILKLDRVSPQFSWFNPVSLNVFLLVVSLVLCVLGYFRGRRYAWFDKAVFTAIGLVGWLIVFLWFFTDHIATKNNLNLIWAWPLFFPFIFFLFREKWKTLRLVVFVVFSMVLVGLLVSWNALPQALHPSLAWLFPALLLRSAFQVFYDVKLSKEKKHGI